MMTLTKEIVDASLKMMAAFEIEDTPSNRLAYLTKVLAYLLEEQSDDFVEKQAYIKAISHEIYRLQVVVMFEK